MTPIDGRTGKKPRGSGSTLDTGNTAAVDFFWKQLTAEHPDVFRAVKDTVLNKDNAGYQELKTHDKQLFIMLRNWVKATEIITAEIALRVQEINDLVAAHQADQAFPPIARSSLRPSVGQTLQSGLARGVRCA